jgi:hypothetical protein
LAAFLKPVFTILLNAWLLPTAISFYNTLIYLYLQVLLLMASALKFPMSEVAEAGVLSILSAKLRTRQQNIAEITEMIHVSVLSVLQRETYLLFFLHFSSCYLSQVASLLHDDVLDDADTRRGVSSLNLIMGNKVLHITLFARAVYEVNQA